MKKFLGLSRRQSFSPRSWGSQAVPARPAARIGWARSPQGLLDTAAADHDRAVALNPQSFVALDERGLPARRRGKRDAAPTNYNAAMEIAPSEAYPRFGRGIVFARKKDRARSGPDLRLARQFDPGVDAVFTKIGFKPWISKP